MEKNRGCSSRSKAKKDEDFEEEEVWQNWAPLVKNKEKDLRPRKSIIPSCVSRMTKVKSQSSGPVSIPDWSKDDSWGGGGGGGGGGAKSHNDGGGFDDDDHDDDEMIPPHEIVARRQARSHVASYSMCEGVGRTLKGRDLSKLRNSILTKTGFLE